MYQLMHIKSSKELKWMSPMRRIKDVAIRAEFEGTAVEHIPNKTIVAMKKLIRLTEVAEVLLRDVRFNGLVELDVMVTHDDDRVCLCLIFKDGVDNPLTILVGFKPSDGCKINFAQSNEYTVNYIHPKLDVKSGFSPSAEAVNRLIINAGLYMTQLGSMTYDVVEGECISFNGLAPHDETTDLYVKIVLDVDHYRFVPTQGLK